MMVGKRRAVLFLVMCMFLLVGCGEIESTQTVTEIECGENTDLTTLIEIEDGASCSLMSTDIDFNMVGEYTAEFKLSKKNKVQNVIYTFSVIDTTVPEITCADTIYLFKESATDISKFITCTDNVDGNLSNSLKITNFDSNISGVQKIELSVADKSGNVANKKIEVHVIEHNLPLEYAEYVYESIKLGLTVPDSFVPKKVEYKNTSEGYIYHVLFENEGFWFNTVENEQYVKVLNDGSVIPWDYAENSYDTPWYDEYVDAASEVVILKLDDIVNMIDEKVAISKSKGNLGIDNEEEIYNNAEIVLAEWNSMLLDFKPLVVYSKCIDGVLYYRIKCTNMGGFGTVTNTWYSKIDLDGKMIYWESEDELFSPLGDSSYYWGIEYLQSPIVEECLNLDNLTY